VSPPPALGRAFCKSCRAQLALLPDGTELDAQPAHVWVDRDWVAALVPHQLTCPHRDPRRAIDDPGKRGILGS